MSAVDVEQIRKIIERLDDLEARVSSLENYVKPLMRKPAAPRKFEGLSGGINKLIDEGFFDAPRSLKEVIEEMRRLGYYYAVPAISTALSRDFMQRKGILTRTGKRGNWKYVLKK